MTQAAKRGKIAAIDASRTPYKIKCDDGDEVRVSTQGASAIRKLKVGDRVELEYAAGDWYAFPASSKTEGRMRTMKDIFEFIDYIPKKKPDGVRLRYTTVGAGPSGEVIVLVNGDTVWAWWAEPSRADPKRNLKYDQSNFLDGVRGFEGKRLGEMLDAFREAATGAYRDSGGSAQAVLKAVQKIVGKLRASHWSLDKAD